MEIKCVKKEKTEYPKINEITNSKLKQYIPNKWMKLGITSFLINLLIKKDVYALSPTEVTPDVLVTAGSLPNYNPIHHVRGMMSLVSGVVLLIGAIIIMYKKARAKTQEEKAKVGKKAKIFFIIASIVFMLNIIVSIILEYLNGL